MSETPKKPPSLPSITNDPWNSEELPYNNTATGYLGVKRHEMLQNPLLRKDRIGRGNSSSDAVFGSNYRSPWTMAHALRGWTGTYIDTAKKETTKPKKRTRIDYMALNRGSLSAAMLTSDETTDFRKQKVRLGQRGSTGGAKRQERPPAKEFNPNTVFGKPNKYQSFEAVISNWYQRQWLLEARQGELKKTVKMDFTKVRPNRASSLRPVSIATGLQYQPWRSPHFLTKAKPNLSTFRSNKAFQDAREFHESDSRGREGQTGQGIVKNTPHEHQLPPMPRKCPDHLL